MTDFLFSVPSGEPVTLEPFHYAIIGQTQFSGKTTLIKRLSEWVAAQGYSVLIFDTKETEADYAGFGNEVPVCLRETTDSFVLIGLLESMFRRRLTPYYATLSRLTEAAKGFDDIIARAREAEAKTKSAWLRDAYRVLYDLLERLQNETSKVETVPKLQLSPGINRMVINDFSLEAQQLIMKNSFEDLLRVYRRKTIGVIDESFKFLPQGYSSAATRAIMNVMTQGAKTELFGWISTQFLAVTDKDPLKACAVKFLGTQDHVTETKHTLDLIPEARSKFSSDDIMKLKLGHWILVRKRPAFVGVVYALPVGVPESVGVEVALGKRSPESVRDNFLKPKVMEVDETVWKEKYMQLEKRIGDIRIETINELKKECESKIEEERQEAYHEALEKVGEIKKQWNVEEYQQTIAELKDGKVTLETELKKLEPLKAFGEALARFLKEIGVMTPSALHTSNTSVGLQATMTIVDVAPVEKSIVINTDTVPGKILAVAKKGKLDGWRQLGEVVKAIEEERWTVTSQQVNNALNDLVKEGLIAKRHTDRNYFCLAQGIKFAKEVEAK
jgi:hypothetical protein